MKKYIKMITYVNRAFFQSQLIVYGRGQTTFTLVVEVPSLGAKVVFPGRLFIKNLVRRHFGKVYIEIDRTRPNMLEFTVGKLTAVERNVLLALLTSHLKFVV